MIHCSCALIDEMMHVPAVKEITKYLAKSWMCMGTVNNAAHPFGYDYFFSVHSLDTHTG